MHSAIMYEAFGSFTPFSQSEITPLETPMACGKLRLGQTFLAPQFAYSAAYDVFHTKIILEN